MPPPERALSVCFVALVLYPGDSGSWMHSDIADVLRLITPESEASAILKSLVQALLRVFRQRFAQGALMRIMDCTCATLVPRLQYADSPFPIAMSTFRRDFSLI